MADTDLFRSRQRRLRMLFGAGGVLGIYFAFVLLLSAGYFSLNFVWIAVAVSIVLQMLFISVMQRGFRTLFARDYSAYRAA